MCVFQFGWRALREVISGFRSERKGPETPAERCGKQWGKRT